jgi:hypothetical protein
MRFLKRFALAAVVLGGNGAQSDTVVVAPFSTGFYLLPAAGGSKLYGPTGPGATWFNAQWNSPADYANYKPFKCPAARTECYTARSPNERAEAYTVGGVQHIVLGERGSNIACGTELDNLLAPVNSARFPGYPAAVVSRPNLGALAKLNVKFTVAPLFDGYAEGVATCSSALTKGSVFFALTLSCPPKQGSCGVSGQTLFYELFIRLFNQPAFSPAFFANSNPFGFHDALDQFPRCGSWPRTGFQYSVPSTFSCDVLPRLKKIISTASNGLDRVLKDWNVGSAYMGNVLYGHVRVESDWSDVSVYSVP